MDSVELYGHLLGLTTPWTVKRVDLQVQGQEVEVHVEHPPGQRFACPQCGRELAVYDHLHARRWRHLDSCQFLTYLIAEPPRVKCSEHGVHQVLLPWAQVGGRFTRMFEALAVEVLLSTDVKHAAQLLRVTWDEAWALMERAVRRGRAAKAHSVPERIGVDEKAIAKGHRYMTLVCDLDGRTVEYIGEDRKLTSLAAYFGDFDAIRLQRVQAVCLDMWQPYVSACQAHVPNAVIVFDRFHIMAHMLDALDRVRRRENKALVAQGDPTLSGSKFLWLYSRQNVPQRFAQRFRELRNSQLKSARAWAIKESLRQLWQYRSSVWARKFFDRWYFWATHSRLAPVIRVAKMIKHRLNGVLSYFEQRITNAVAEGLNSKIATIQKRACGLRNPEHFKTAVFFHCGGLNLAPPRFVTHTKV